MGKASSAKKVARAARAGGTRRIGRQRNLGFPITIAVIIVLGILLVITARDRRQATAAPKVNVDHWHAAYGIYLCDHFLDPQPQEATDALGIHTHGEGVIHIHPFLDSAAGTNARLGLFFDDVQIEVTDKKISASGETKQEGKDKCDGKDAIVQVAAWNNADDATAGKKPTQVFTNDFSKIRFRNDRMAFTIAFLPEDATIPAPESIPELDRLTDVPGATTTTVAGDTSSTTAPGDTSSTTAPGDTSTSSTAPPASNTTSTTG